MSSTPRSRRAGRSIAGPLLAAATLLAAPMAAPRAAAQLRVPTDTFTLANGLKVVVHEDHSAPLVAVNVWYHVGSGREVDGRSGFAHLFEHMLFQGSQNVGDDQHFAMIQEAGGTLNGSTNSDRTNYFELLPSNYLELGLWLEADRMGFLLPAMTQAKLDNQRDVVKNERRQNYENRPYGLAFIRMGELMYPKGHPYHRPTIGYQEDLSAASLEDVKGFFRQWYVPNNASLVVAGDVEPAKVRKLVEKYFAGIPRGAEPAPLAPQPVALERTVRDVMEDRVTLPQVSIAWHSAESWSKDQAALSILGNILGSGKSSRLYERLVYRDQAAQSAFAGQQSRPLAGTFQVTVQAREGVSLSQMERAVDEELARIVAQGITPAELERAKTRYESEFVLQLQGTLGKADQLNNYVTNRGAPDMFEQDLARYRAVTAADVQRVAAQYLKDKPRVVLSVVPQGKKELAAMPTEATP